MAAKLLTVIGLTIGSIAISNAAPCYTDIENGCKDNKDPTYVKTKNTNTGFCTEYINTQKQSVMHCYETPPVTEDQLKPVEQPKEKKLSDEKQANIINITYTVSNQSQQINEYNKNNTDNMDNNYSYWGSSNYQGYYNDNNSWHRPEHRPNHRPDHRPPPRPPQNTTLPSAIVKGSSKRSNASSPVPTQNYNRPNGQRPPRPNHHPPSKNQTMKRTSLPSASFDK